MTIKELRAEKKLSQKAFGESLGISAAAVAKLEKDNKPSEKVIKAVKDVYGVDLTVEGAAEAVKEPAKKAPAKKAPAKKEAEPKAAAEKKEEEPKAAPAKEEKKEEKKPAKKPAKKAEVKKVEAEKPAEEKKPAKKASAKAAKTEVFIQSAMGGTITVEDILGRLDAVDTVYIKVEENKAYWVKGDKNGSINLW